MLQLLTTDAFADWFSKLDDTVAEDVATALEVIEQLGPDQAPPESSSSILWYEAPSVSRFGRFDSLAWDLQEWGTFRDYAKQVLQKLESPRFISRLTRLGEEQSAAVFKAIREIRKESDPRMRWGLALAGGSLAVNARVRAKGAQSRVRQLYFTALEAAGFEVADVPAHSLGLREFSRRVPAPAFRLLYGVDVRRQTALFVVGEWLDRSFYGDSVRHAERQWKHFLRGELRSVEPPQLR